MPKLICLCDEVLSYSEIPCKIEYKFISDVDYDNYVGMVDAEDLYQAMNSFLVCQNCNRLWVFWKGYKNKPTGYAQETKKY